MMSKNARQFVDFVQLAGERARQVEPEAVYVHLKDPVAEASP